MSADYEKLVAEETLIFEVAEAICEAMGPSDEDNGEVARAELARRMGVTKGHITQLLAGERNMTLRTVADICFALGLRAKIELEPIPAPPGEKAARR